MPAYGQPVSGPRGLGQKRTGATKMDEFNRKYGSVDRVLWMHRQPSVVSGEMPCVNAHIGVGGMGYKADATTIVPLTKDEHDLMSQPNGGIETFCAKYSVTVEWLLEQAAAIEVRWQAYLAQGRPW